MLSGTRSDWTVQSQVRRGRLDACSLLGAGQAGRKSTTVVDERAMWLATDVGRLAQITVSENVLE